MRYVGVDLTSAFRQVPRAVDIAAIEDNHVEFSIWPWPREEAVMQGGAELAHSFCEAINWDPKDTVVAIDGPQALARQEPQRVCERMLGTPGRTPTQDPQDLTPPFCGYILSSLKLFRALLHREEADFRLAGLGNMPCSDFNLFEAFPGAEWTILLGQQPPRKGSIEGRQIRSLLWDAMLLQLPPGLLTPDQNDALACACLARWAHVEPDRVALVGDAPYFDAAGLLREGYILHADHQVKIGAGGRPETEEAPGDSEDWAGDGHYLKFTDRGLVHGGAPENSWLEPRRNYHLRTAPPNQVIEFTLRYSPTFPGGRGWACAPSIEDLLSGALGCPAPAPLTAASALVLPVEILAVEVA